MLENNNDSLTVFKKKYFTEFTIIVKRVAVEFGCKSAGSIRQDWKMAGPGREITEHERCTKSNGRRSRSKIKQCN